MITQTSVATRIVTANVGNFDALNNNIGTCAYGNLATHSNKAIIKLQLRPATRTTFDTWAQNIGTNTRNLEVVVERNDKRPCAYGNSTTEVGGAGTFLNDDTARFGIVNKNFYDIYHGDDEYNFLPMRTNGGNIKKRIRKIFNNNTRTTTRNNINYQPVVYFYFDRYDNEHEVCVAEKYSVTAKRRTNVPPLNQRGNVISTISYVANRNAGESIAAHTLTIYQNGTLGEGGNGIKWYANQGNDVELINADIVQQAGMGSQVFTALNYISPDNSLIITFGYEDTRRRYANPDLFAAFIGALAQLKTNQATQNAFVTSEGFAYEDASCYPSSMHVNGNSVDTHYFSQKGQQESYQQPFINFLYDFGFAIHYIGCNMHYTHGTRDCNPAQAGTSNFGQIHDTHLHSGGLAQNILDNFI